MSINIQLVEIPENEQVSSRQIALPSNGGTIGRAYDCTIQLPDFSKSLSRVHAEVSRDDSGRYQVVNKSTNGMLVNGNVLAKGQYHTIGDGDIWKVGEYLLLITDLSVLSAPELEEVPAEKVAQRSEPIFNVDEFDISDAQVIEAESLQMRNDESEALKAPLNIKASQPNSNRFSAENALSDVQLGADPFEDEQMQPSSFGAAVTVETVADSHSDGMQKNLQQLTALLAQQQNNPDPYSYDTLMQCINSSMDKFIEELAPEYLEEMFNSYITGWGSKEKKYWQLYRKQFKRKMARQEFHRQFASIFMEELRGKR